MTFHPKAGFGLTNFCIEKIKYCAASRSCQTTFSSL